MSSDDKNKKIDDTETEEDKSSQDEADLDKSGNNSKSGVNDDKAAVNDVKSSASTNDEGTDGEGDTEEEKEEVKKPAKKRPVKADKKEEEEEEKDDEKGESDEEEEDDYEDEKKNGVEAKEVRERKKVERFTEEVKKESHNDGEVNVPNGKGTPLGQCPRLEFLINQQKYEQLKKLHQVLYGRVGKAEKVKSNLFLFKGFDYEPESDAYTKKKQSIAKYDVKHLREMCEILDVEKKGKKDEIVTRIMDFLCMPKDSGKAVPATPAPRPKRTSAVKANNRGYAGLDADDSEDEGRRGRGTGRRTKSKRPSYKDETSSEEDTRGGRRAPPKFSENDSEVEESVGDVSGSDEDSEGVPKKKKAAPAKKKAPPKKKAPAKPKAPAKKTPAKRGRAKKESDSEEQSESEDEPLQKKSKKLPSDDEIKKYVKQILEGANLEEITMKTVCKQVYARFPDHDLTHKKDLIKTTVKSLIAS